jgi:hypothetical protein
MEVYKRNVNYISARHNRKKQHERNDEWYDQDCREIV